MTSATPLLPALPTRLAILTVSVAVLVGCSPGPEPTPTPTAVFASEEEAFAAAEATYRAYNDALNQVDFAAPETFEPVYSSLSGTVADSTRKAFSEFHAEGIRMVGATHYDSFIGISADPRKGIVSAAVCTDVGDVEVTNASGTSIVSADRPSRQSIDVRFVTRSGGEGLTISKLDPSKDERCER